MAPVTYYYFFSIISLLGISSWLINLIYMRLRNRTIFGRVYTVGTPVYKRVMKVASGSNVLITSVITLLALLNLVWSVVMVLRVNTSDARLLLVIAPIVSLIGWVFMMIKLPRQYGIVGPEKEHGKVSRKHDKSKEDSWLS